MKRAWKLRRFCVRMCVRERVRVCVCTVCVGIMSVWAFCSYSLGDFFIPREKNKAGEGIEGKSTPTRHILKVAGPQALTIIFFFFFFYTQLFPPHIELVLLLQHDRPEACMWAAFGGLMRKVPQSQVFVSISAGINRLSRRRSRPSAITGPEAESSTCSSVFTKWANCSFIFLYLFF